MGYTKRTAFFLLLIFCTIATLDYWQNSKHWHAHVQRNQQQITNTLQSVIDTPNDNPARKIYTQLSELFAIEFYQFRQLQTGVTLTHGQNLPRQRELSTLLFPAPSTTHYHLTINGVPTDITVKVILSPNVLYQRTLGLAGLLGSTWLLFVLYLLILGIGQRKKISYLSSYISQLASLTFTPVQASRLKGAYRPVAVALEQCRKTLQHKISQFESENAKLNQVAFIDPMTGFGSQQKFTQLLDKLAKNKEHISGMLALIKATELSSINQANGRDAGDDYLTHIAHCLRQVGQTVPAAQYFRIASGDFILYLPELTLSNTPLISAKLQTSLNHYQQNTQLNTIAHTGLVPCQSGPAALHVLTRADIAVSIAQTQGPNAIYILQSSDEHAPDAEQWQNELRNLIRERRIKLQQQPISAGQQKGDCYTELLATFYNPQHSALPTRTVIAMAERYALGTELDKLIIATAVHSLSQNAALRGSFGINISPTSIISNDFLAWLKQLLSRHTSLASRLVFELPENGMQTNLPAAYRFVRLIHSLGARVAIERFGNSYTAFKFFREVKPDFIKLDSNYSRNIAEDSNNQFFIRMIVDIARRMGIRVIATAVEQQHEKMMLEKLLLDGLQGYYIARPQPLSAQAETPNHQRDTAQI
ncbi:diguanylate cyclase [Shewanella sp. NFH-SH190041]|uniref:EAL domain-containing protein n=1 Tax=Shewanella sp. NFH-SH190041 TaxID=2950245 RepID=UPI0021C2DCFD|nr:GGDEF domain-containing protein [Shewanella sp. NFH-SH190041]BDM64013.1 diguanylate cyclase [Shewanella sp. NFH-SH190041]